MFRVSQQDKISEDGSHGDFHGSFHICRDTEQLKRAQSHRLLGCRDYANLIPVRHADEDQFPWNVAPGVPAKFSLHFADSAVLFP
jgi:hypothetical protein